MIDIAGVVLSLLLLRMLSSVLSKSGTTHSTGSASAGSSGSVSGVTSKDRVAFSGGVFVASRLLFVQHFERNWAQLVPVRQQEHFAVRHFDERLKVQQPMKGLLCRVFLAGGKSLSVKEDSTRLGKVSLHSDSVDEDASMM